MSDSPLILSALFLLDVGLAGKGATRLGIDIIEKFEPAACAEAAKMKTPRRLGGAFEQ
jgi:hypothetical protein